MNPFSIKSIDGVPRLLKDGKPVFPLFFWQTEVEEWEATNFSNAGVELYTCFRSGPYYEHPYWVGEGEYDYSWYDERIEAFFKKLPNAYLVPRIFVSAPYWWLEKHPDEMVGFSKPVERVKGFGGHSNFHESFASELWKKEQGEAFRQFVRHIKNGPYGDRIIGIHVAAGTCGEWHPWGGGPDRDCGPAMTKRYGKPIPPEKERKADYYECYFSAGSDAVEHFCRIVKEESPDCLTVIFNGYFIGGYVPMSHHRGLIRLLDSPYIDILTAPHDYAQREPGKNGYFRAFPASLARHGKLFIDEADDRTPLATRTWLNGRIKADTANDAVHFMRREFGNALTHCLALWYMDIDGGMFRDAIYMKEVSRARYWGDRAMELPMRRVSQVAVLADETGNFHLPDGKTMFNIPEGTARISQFQEFCNAGAPFDLFIADDVDEETLSKYRVIVALDGVALSDRVRNVLKKLQRDGRAFIWGYGAGSIRRGTETYSTEAMEELTGMRFTKTAEQPMLMKDIFFNNIMTTVSPGFLPREAMADFDTWTSWYFGGQFALASSLREIYRRAGVFIYNEDGDVLSASESAIMLHASSTGEKTIYLPTPKTVTDMGTCREIGRGITRFTFHLERGETALFELR